MSKEIFISSTPHETRLAIVENDDLTEIYYERENEYTLAGSIYNGKVTRVLPGMQSSFVDIGLERDAFLYITDFMEEAGDTADFDSGDGQRGGRQDNRRGERSGSRDGHRDAEHAAPETALPSAAGSQDGGDAGHGLPEREGGRDRNGRGGRNRRGGRDRNGNRERQPGVISGEPSSEASSLNAPGAEPDLHAGYVAEPTAGIPVHEGDAGDVGEGAPGADGSRRWRGRRGRRGRREVGEANDSTQSAAAPVDSAAAPSDGYEDDGFDMDAAAAAPLAPVIAPVEEVRGEREPRGIREGRGSREGGGSRESGGRDRGGRDRSGRPLRSPRGFAPRTALYGVENAAPAYGETAESAAPAGEPIVLPGESLSKYRKSAEEPAGSATATTGAPAAAPSTEFTLSEAWNGGLTLPGESLSRHRGQEGRSEQRAPRQNVEQRGSRQNVSREIQESRNAPVAHESPAGVHEDVAPSREYEPKEASASYRVDPAAPSEFRQSGPAAVEENLAHTVTPAPEAAEEERFPQGLKSQFDFGVNGGAEAKPLQNSGSSIERQDAVGVIPSHDLTTVSSAGEMVSAAPATEPEAVVAANASPAAPIAHESAVVGLQGSAEDAFPQGLKPHSNLGVNGGAEAPPFQGSRAGVEVSHLQSPDEGGSNRSGSAVQSSDEEDYATTLHASSIEEMDEFDEEETLEGAADLGTMLREMSIDQITRPNGGPELDETEEEEDSMDEHDMEEFEEEEEEDDSEHRDDEADTEEDVLHEEMPAEFGSREQPENEGHETALAGGAVRDSQGDTGREHDHRRGRRDGREGGRRDGRRDGRRGDRSRSAGGAGDRERSGGRGGRHSMQTTNLPAISDLLKPGQEVLVQIAKEPIAKKGARITSHIALPGRFLVFMPTVNHTGVSRKIESDGERRRLKEILLSEKGEASGGFIVRTAASGASEEELRSDLRFLLNLWADIKQRSESSKSPALIYHDLNLVERILRDQVTDNFSAIWVDTETEYERVLRFLQRFQPSLIRRVKLYSKEVPLFEQFGITEEINKALRSKVWLKSGGSIVINQTEALVAIDINTGKFVGKTARLEDTIVKTNLDAIPEIVRQIRLRDLGGIIIIDFIDMDERKNRNRVMAALEDELKNDRAPSKILQFNDFGLVAITRKRVKQSLERTLSTTCNICQGTGMVKSPVTVCNDIYIEMRKMHKNLDRGDVMLRVHPDVVKQLKSSTKWLQEMEEMAGKTILVKSDPSLHPEQFDIH